MKQFAPVPLFILAASTASLPLAILMFLTGVALGLYLREDKNEDR
jgi:hypothetical protein